MEVSIEDYVVEKPKGKKSPNNYSTKFKMYEYVDYLNENHPDIFFSAKELAVYHYFLRYLSTKPDSTYIVKGTLKVICRKTGFSLSSVRRALNNLVEWGFLTIEYNSHTIHKMSEYYVTELHILQKKYG